MALKMETYVFAQFTGPTSGNLVAINIDGATSLHLRNSGSSAILIGTSDQVVYNAATRTAPNYIGLAAQEFLNIQVSPKQRMLYVFTVDGSGGALNVTYTTNNNE